MNFIVISLLVFIVAVTMTMVGKGGGNFYVVILALANIPMHEAATTGQFILLLSSVAAMMIFQKNRSVSWALAAFVGVTTAVSAFAGGYFSHWFTGFALKLIFAFMLLIAGTVMLIPVPENKHIEKKKQPGIINIKSGGEVYAVKLSVALPVTFAAGLGAGMVGVSGGSFLVPLMVLACGVPMHTAVGTASTLIATTALMGFAGHAAQGDFNPSLAVPLACITIAGGILGGRFALQTKPKHLKKLFAYTNWLAALFMLANALLSKGNM